MNDQSADLQAVVAAALAPLAARIEQLFVEQLEQADSLAQVTARLDEIAEQVALLRGQALLLDRRTEDTARLTYGARNIVMQAEHHMQQEIASVNERLLDITADIHRLHHIRESPEHKLYRLNSEMTVIQHRLSQLEGTGASS